MASSPTNSQESPERKKLRLSAFEKALPPCPYGEKCYRKNPKHFEEFSHPFQQPQATTSHELPVNNCSSVDSNVIDQMAKEFGFYLFRCPGVKYRNIPTITLKEIFHQKHGDLVSSAQFNYMFDVDWLMQQYPKQFRSCPLLLVHAYHGQDKAALNSVVSKYENIRQCVAHIRLPFGTHHTKMMFLKYADGLRIVIHTANMIPDDWDRRTQGIWLSPKLLRKSDTSSETDSDTKFRETLVNYLRGYGSTVAGTPSSPLGEWIEELLQYDFSPIRVFLVGSVSGMHGGSSLKHFGHPRLANLLQDYTLEVPSSWPLIGQFSSIGSLGAQPTTWLTTQWSSSLAGKGARGLRMIFPCVDDVRNSLEGYAAGGCLPYSRQTAEKQPWLRQFLHRWCAGPHSRAAPHIKSYTRISNDGTHASWFLLTSANLSKAAWGSFVKDGSQLMIRSYELGVLFVPGQFQEKANCFRLVTPSRTTTPSDALKQIAGMRTHSIPFPVPYDLPPVLYDTDDDPWVVDVRYSEPDVFGRFWRPN
ncbi:tyrosyl-DNA phosphodiesterase 1 [Clonorchis sinensis]|uniref:Tyrosyl-DNA phosphodiesterase 1 n=1 Tax=Clonorchis sinensis TaxID=79923 RepID=A0A8T1MUH4_CLOSI|nr:tyrosyl-DNA phosphodiesterase 1 [Clonorchis sinensis]